MQFSNVFTMKASTFAMSQRLGGKIFYIHSASTGATYTFFDSNGNVLTDVQVGDEPYSYFIDDTRLRTQDKYYIVSPSIAPLATSYPWTYKDSNGNWVYESLGTNPTIGYGKSNTSLIMSASNGIYTEKAGLWKSCKNLNDSLFNNCSDWYIGSWEEMYVLRDAVDRSGKSVTPYFSMYGLYTSTEESSSTVRAWVVGSASFLAAPKTVYTGALPIRSF